MKYTFIGDVHGDADKLSRLIDRLELDGRTLIFLGDIVNHGPSSRSVIERLLTLKDDGVQIQLVQGNHEAELLDFIHNGDFVRFARVGGIPTIKSYVSCAMDDVHRQFASEFPATHYDFIVNSKLFVEDDSWIASHAGIDPLAPYKRDISVLRDGVHESLFERSPTLSKPVIFGHYAQKSFQPFCRENVICVDTGCGMLNGPLTALLYPEMEFLQVGATKCLRISK
tara:strand:+ start:352 stop:1029 length:678 start_codon:yes stop_codon:yes gene_type:complete